MVPEFVEVAWRCKVQGRFGGLAHRRCSSKVPEVLAARVLLGSAKVYGAQGGQGGFVVRVSKTSRGFAGFREGRKRARMLLGLSPELVSLAPMCRPKTRLPVTN